MSGQPNVKLLIDGPCQPDLDAKKHGIIMLKYPTKLECT